ncbi:MAG: hypothetical protein ABIO70_11395, partial [Pseudomonadota bacterium]
RPGLRARRARLEVGPAAREQLAARGYDPTWGARHLQRTLRRDLVAPVACALNAASEHPDGAPGDALLAVDLADGRLSPRLLAAGGDRDGQAEQASLARTLDAIEEARRRAGAIRVGSRHAQLESARAILARARQRVGEEAWYSHPDAGALRRVEAVLADLREVIERTAAVDLDGALLALTDTGDARALQAAWAALQKRARQVYRATFAHLHPQDCAVIGAYGPLPRAMEVMEIYRRVADRLGFTARRWRVWLTRANAVHAVPEDGQAPDSCNHLFGLELALEGPGVGPLFALEAGIQLWEGRPESRVLVAVEPVAWAAWAALRPENAHRSNAAAGRWRRQHGAEGVKDRAYGHTFGPVSCVRELQEWLLAAYEAQILADLEG